MSLGATYVEGDDGELYTEPPLAGDGWHVGWDDGDMLVSVELRGGSPAEAFQRAERELVAAGIEFTRNQQYEYLRNSKTQVTFICTAKSPVPVAMLPKGRTPVQSWDRYDAITYLLFTDAARERMRKARGT